MFSLVRRHSGRSSVLSVEEGNPEKTKKNKLSSVGVLTAAITECDRFGVWLDFFWGGGAHGGSSFYL